MYEANPRKVEQDKYSSQQSGTQSSIMSNRARSSLGIYESSRNPDFVTQSAQASNLRLTEGIS